MFTALRALCAHTRRQYTSRADSRDMCKRCLSTAAHRRCQHCASSQPDRWSHGGLPICRSRPCPGVAHNMSRATPVSQRTKKCRRTMARNARFFVSSEYRTRRAPPSQMWQWTMDSESSTVLVFSAWLSASAPMSPSSFWSRVRSTMLGWLANSEHSDSDSAGNVHDVISALRHADTRLATYHPQRTHTQ